MSSETGNTQARKEQRGSDSPNIELQKAQERDPGKSNARDRENRKGGDNAKNL
jgi:hypothetical protein